MLREVDLGRYPTWRLHSGYVGGGPCLHGGGIPALRFAGESDKWSARVSITVGRLPQIITVVIEVVSQRVA